MDPSLVMFSVTAFIIYVVFWLFAMASLLARNDLPAVEKLMWVIVMIFVAFFGLIFYLTLAPRRQERRNDRANQLSGTPWENNPGHRSRSGT